MTRAAYSAVGSFGFVRSEMRNAARDFFLPVRSVWRFAKQGPARGGIVAIASLGAIGLCSFAYLPETTSSSADSGAIIVASPAQVVQPEQKSSSEPAAVYNLDAATNAASISASVKKMRQSQSVPIRFKVVASIPADPALQANTTVVPQTVLVEGRNLDRLDKKLQDLENRFGYKFNIRKVRITESAGDVAGSVLTQSDVHPSDPDAAVLTLKDAQAAQREYPIKIILDPAVSSGDVSSRADKYIASLTSKDLAGSVIRVVEIVAATNQGAFGQR